jgi:hypothetical protein
MAGAGNSEHAFSSEVAGTVLLVSNQPMYISTVEYLNTTAAIAYLQIFWKAVADVTIGTTTPDVVIGLPASGGAVIPFADGGWKTRGTSFSIAATTTRTGLTGAAVSVTIWKKL